MSEPPSSWFHCARCGALFLSPVGDNQNRTCTECGSKPSLGVAAAAPPATREPTILPEPREPKETREKHRRRKNRAGGLMLKLVFGWSAVMLAIVMLANHCWQADEATRTAWQPPDDQPTLTAEDFRLLQSHGDACRQTLAGLLAGNSPESLNPFVFNAIATLPDMVRYYALNPTTRLGETTVEPAGLSVVHLPDGPAIEGRWRTDDGRLIDAVFRNERGEWRVDWHDFARFSDHPWPLFLAGDGPDEGEFRLLARQRLAREELTPDRPLSIVFHNPRFANPQDVGAPSPEFELDQQSPAAQLLIAGFQQARNGIRPFRALLPPVDPDDMIRVRVRIRRVEENGARTFEIVEVFACHWLEIDGETGIVEPLREDN